MPATLTASVTMPKPLRKLAIAHHASAGARGIWVHALARRIPAMKAMKPPAIVSVVVSRFIKAPKPQGAARRTERSPRPVQTNDRLIDLSYEAVPRRREFGGAGATFA